MDNVLLRRKLILALARVLFQLIYHFRVLNGLLDILGHHSCEILVRFPQGLIIIIDSKGTTYTLKFSIDTQKNFA